MRHAHRSRHKLLRRVRRRLQAGGPRDQLDRVMSASIVETHALAKTYQLAPVLRDVNLRVLPGRGAFVIGGNGAGKSTLLRILAGLEAPSAGRAMVADPILLLLDEPFAALDAVGVSIVASLILGALERGAAVLATAHAVPEIEGAEFEVFELSHGRFMHYPPKEEFRRGGRIRSLLGR